MEINRTALGPLCPSTSPRRRVTSFVNSRHIELPLEQVPPIFCSPMLIQSPKGNIVAFASCANRLTSDFQLIAACVLARI